MSSEQKPFKSTDKSADKSADNGNETQFRRADPLRIVRDETGKGGKETTLEYESELPTVRGAMDSIESMREKQSKVRIWQSWKETAEGRQLLKVYRNPRILHISDPASIAKIKEEHEVDLKALATLYESIVSLTKTSRKDITSFKTQMTVEKRDEFREARQKFDDQMRQLVIPNQISPKGIGPRRVLYVSGKNNDCPFRSLLKSAHYSDKRWEEGWSDERVEQEVTSARKHLVGQRLTKHGEYIGLSEPDGRKLIQYFRDKNLIRPELGIRVILHNERGFYGHINLNYSYELSSTEETEMVEQEKIKITINHMRYYWI